VDLSAVDISQDLVEYVSQSNRKIGLPLRRKSSIKKAIFADLLTNFESKIPLTVKASSQLAPRQEPFEALAFHPGKEPGPGTRSQVEDHRRREDEDS